MGFMVPCAEKKGEAGMGNSLKVMLVDDKVTILEGFKRLFDWKAYGCEVVCEALDGVTRPNCTGRILLSWISIFQLCRGWKHFG